MDISVFLEQLDAVLLCDRSVLPIKLPVPPHIKIRIKKKKTCELIFFLISSSKARRVAGAGPWGL